MNVEIGDSIKVNELPSYKESSWPSLPIKTRVADITYDQMVIVEIESRRFELYEDDGYEKL